MLTSKHLTNHDNHNPNITAERKRIARDLHDGVAQQFAHVLHKLEFIERLLEIQEQQPPQLQIVLDEIRRTYTLQKTALDELREHITALLPTPVGATFMTPALPMESHEDTASHPQTGVMNVAPTAGESTGNGAWLSSPLSLFIEEFRQQNPQIVLSFVDENTHDLTTALIVPIFRIVQEALNNVQKHAQAKHVTVRVCVLPHDCTVEIIDDGVGFQVPLNIATFVDPTDTPATPNDTTNNTGLGLHIMQERVQEAGGEWELYSTPGKGTTVKARFPL